MQLFELDWNLPMVAILLTRVKTLSSILFLWTLYLKISRLLCLQLKTQHEVYRATKFESNHKYGASLYGLMKDTMELGGVSPLIL